MTYLEKDDEFSTNVAQNYNLYFGVEEELAREADGILEKTKK